MPTLLAKQAKLQPEISPVTDDEERILDEMWREMDQAVLLVVPEGMELAYCPTGKGGGIDPTCSPRTGNAAVQTSLLSKADIDQKLRELDSQLIPLYQERERIKKLAADERALSPKNTATSKTKRLRKENNKKIEKLEEQIKELQELKKTAKPGGPTPPKAPKPKKSSVGTHDENVKFSNFSEAQHHLTKEYATQLEKGGSVDKERVIEVAQIYAQEMARTCNKFERVDDMLNTSKRSDQGLEVANKRPFDPQTGITHIYGKFEVTDKKSKQFDGHGVEGKNAVGMYWGGTNNIGVMAHLRSDDTAFPLTKDSFFNTNPHNVGDCSMPSVIRHEMGHRFWYQGLKGKERIEWENICRDGKYAKDEMSPVRWKVGSATPLTIYAKTNVREFHAEAFAAITHPAYGKESWRLPAEVEEFMNRTMGKRTMQVSKLPSGMELAFCPTGKGGGVDPTCSPSAATLGPGPNVDDPGFAGEDTTPPPPGDFYEPDVEADHNGDGVTDAARVGVPGTEHDINKIDRLPNLTPIERQAESEFADAFEADPEGHADAFLLATKLTAYARGEPPVFETDAAKNMYGPWRGDGFTQEQKMKIRATVNTPLHQTANAITKKAFVKHLDTLQEGDEIMVTVGGCGAGKGHVLNPKWEIQPALEMKARAKAVWDSAGDQNATENPWIQEQAEARGLKVNYLFVNADPYQRWNDPKSGVVQRANNPKDGRMVDAKVFADSYAIGARNHKAFHETHKDNPKAAFTFIDSSGDKPRLVDSVPDKALGVDRHELVDFALAEVRSAAHAPAHVKRGAQTGIRIWQK